MSIDCLGNRTPNDHSGYGFPLAFRDTESRPGNRDTKFSPIVRDTDFLSILSFTDFPSILWDTVFLSTSEDTDFPSIVWVSEPPSPIRSRRDRFSSARGQEDIEEISCVKVSAGGGARNNDAIRSRRPLPSRPLRFFWDTALELSRSGRTIPAISLST